MTVSTGTLRPIELRDEADIDAFFRRRSNRSLVPQLPQRPKRVLQSVNHGVERALDAPTLDGGAEVADDHARLGRLVAASIQFVMQPARVRG